jgi:NAD(P)-dependent dehydrogenase (short-subunit alcohol dehydrogenase family)
MPTKYLDKLRGKTVVVVGGSSGIGYGIAEGALEFGANVVIASRSESKVAAAVEALKNSDPEHAANIRGHTVDLDTLSNNTEEQLVKLFDFATDNGAKKVDHVVETAGDLSLRGKLTLETATPELMAQATAVRLVGVVLLAKVAAKYLNKEYTSSLTLTSGAMLYRPRPGLSPFLGAVGGKESMIKGLALDMTPVRV